MPAFVGTRLAFELHGILPEDGSSKEQRSMMFSAVQAVTQPNPIRIAGRNQPNIPTKATAVNLMHILTPESALTHASQSAPPVSCVSQ